MNELESLKLGVLIESAKDKLYEFKQVESEGLVMIYEDMCGLFPNLDTQHFIDNVMNNCESINGDFFWRGGSVSNDKSVFLRNINSIAGVEWKTRPPQLEFLAFVEFMYLLFQKGIVESLKEF